LTTKELSEHPFVIMATYVLIIFFVVASTKAYLGYLTVQQTIQGNEYRKTALEQQMAYLRDFRLPYLESEYALYFANHENAIALPIEQVIKFVKQSEQTLPDQGIVSPSGARKTPTPQGS
jgi:hypothetical protein